MELDTTMSSLMLMTRKDCFTRNIPEWAVMNSLTLAEVGMCLKKIWDFRFFAINSAVKAFSDIFNVPLLARR